MNQVYLLEIDYGAGYQVESVWRDYERADEAGAKMLEQIQAHSAQKTSYRVLTANVK